MTYETRLAEGKPFNPYKLFNGIHIPNQLVKCPHISDAVKILMGRLFQFAGENGRANPYRKTLAKSCGWTVVKLDRVIKRAKDDGLLDTVQENDRSASDYIFLYNKIYDGLWEDAPTDKNDNTPAVKNDKRGAIKNDSRGAIKNDNQEESTLLFKESTKDKQKSTYVDLASRLDGKTDPTDQDVETILEYWKFNDGKVHKSDSASGAVKIKNAIYELLIEGRNPYIALCDDPDLRFKQWTVDEIIKCIDYHVAVLHKDISKSYFDQFILFRNYSGRGRTVPDYSPLVHAYQKIRDNILDLPSQKLKEKLSPTINGTPVSPKIFSRASKYLTYIEDKYKVSDSACVSLRKSMLNLFVRYVEEKKNNTKWKIEYIAGNTFRDEFISNMLERNAIIKKKSKRVGSSVVYY